MSRLRFDVHTHYLGGAVAAWRERTSQQIRGGYRISVRWSPDTAFEFPDRHDIAAQILSFPMSFTGLPDDADFASRFGREINEEYTGPIEKYRGRFGAFAAVPVDTPERALIEIESALDVLGLDGVLLTSNNKGRAPATPWSPSPSGPEPRCGALHSRGFPGSPGTIRA
jgi:predicted TIM-barrel fold metal-dependent hydrolase